jgi:hypothetical protein
MEFPLYLYFDSIVHPKVHTQFLKFYPLFFMALEVLKEKSMEMNLKARKEAQILRFSTDFGLFYHFEKLKKIFFSKNN